MVIIDFKILSFWLDPNSLSNIGVRPTFIRIKPWKYFQLVLIIPQQLAANLSYQDKEPISNIFHILFCLLVIFDRNKGVRVSLFYHKVIR